MKFFISSLICFVFIAFCTPANADQEILDRLREGNWNEWHGNDRYDLAMMGNKTAAFLVNTLSDESENASRLAYRLLNDYYADPDILPSLTKLFFQSKDNSIRSKSIHLISSVDVEYAKKLISPYLNDKDMEETVVSVLSNLEDERVIPILVDRLEVPESRKHAVFALAHFRDKRAIPILLEILDDPSTPEWLRKDVVVKLAYVADGQTILRVLPFIGNDYDLSQKIVNALSPMDPSAVTSLLKTIEQTNVNRTTSKWFRLLEIIGNQKNPALLPIYEKALLETSDPTLHEALSLALSNMGSKGFEALLRILQKKPSLIIFQYISTYNTLPDFDLIASLASDESFPLRIGAIRTLLCYKDHRKDEASKYLLRLLPDCSSDERLVIIESLIRTGDFMKVDVFKQLNLLLADADIEVRLLTIDLIRRMNISVMAPALRQLSNVSNGSLRDAAQLVYDILMDSSQIGIEIEMNQQRYNYGQDITLMYHIRNVSGHPIKLAFYKLPTISLDLNIQQPDGTFAQYKGPKFSLRSLTIDDYHTLKPSEEITHKLSISKYYQLTQPGLYYVKLQITPVNGGLILLSTFSASEKDISLGKKATSSFIAWSGTLASAKVPFYIEPLPTDELKHLMSNIDSEFLREENSKRIYKTCRQLVSFGTADAINTIKTLALMGVVPSDEFRYNLKLYAGSLLLKYPDNDLVPTWIEILNKKRMNPVDDFTEYLIALGISGDERAIEPLRQVAFRHANYGLPERAALALQKHGDNSAVEWFTKIAFRKLRHWNEKERQKGVQILNRIYPQKTQITTKLHNLRNPQFYSNYYFLYLDWEDIREKSKTLDGLKALLKHESPIIQKSAAYELAYQGDSSGIHLIRKDLHANESSIRMHACITISSLSPK